MGGKCSFRQEIGLKILLHITSLRNSRLFLFIILLLVNSVAMTAEIIYNANYSLTHHDNINQVLTPVSDEWVHSARGTMILVENSPKMVAYVNATLLAQHYQNKQQEDAVTGNLFAEGRWIIKPRHFEWFLSDIYTQTAINPLQSDIQSNRQDTNTFLTGPNYFLRLNSLNNLNFEARAGRVDYSTTNEDNNRVSAAMRWLYQVNSTMTDSINWEIEKLDFDDASLDDYHRKNLYARIEYINGRNTFAAEAGVTNIDYELQENQEGQRYLFSIENQRTSTSNIELRYSHRITDTATELLISSLNLPITEINPAGSLIPASDIYTDDTLFFEYNNTTSTGAIILTLNQSAQDFKTQNTFDQISTTLSLNTTYNFSQVSSLALEALQTKTKYVNIVPLLEDIDNRLGLTYSYNSSRNLRLSFSLFKTERTSTNTTRNFQDNAAMITLTYTSR